MMTSFDGYFKSVNWRKSNLAAKNIFVIKNGQFVHPECYVPKHYWFSYVIGPGWI